MAGVYFHIPFCRQACTYCDFHFSVNLSNISEVIEAMQSEIHQRNKYLPESSNIESIYFGGGTPSIVDVKHIEGLIESISKQYSLADRCEITLEGNPDDLTLAKLKELSSIGINRLSIGMQSIDNITLNFMNRSHDASQSIQSVRNAFDAGINNISVDLIYGVPDRSTSQWESELKEVLKLPVTHLSAYSLTVEDKTVLGKMVKEKTVVMPEDEFISKQFHILNTLASEYGFEHYEISNLAKPGYHSVHNSNYWNAIPYIGIGPGAHSFDGSSRSWNVKSNKAYTQKVSKGSGFNTTEYLTKDQIFNEYIMTHLRIAHGVDLEFVKTILNENELRKFNNIIDEVVIAGYASIQENYFKLSIDGWLICDTISVKLFK